MMRTSVTKTIRELVKLRMDPAKEQPTVEELVLWTNAVPIYTDEIMEFIEMISTHPYRPGILNGHLVHIHKECIWMMNKVDQITPLSSQMDALKVALLACLEQIIERLLTDHDHYLDKGVRMPCRHVINKQAKIKGLRHELATIFSAQRIDKKLEALIFYCIDECLRCERCTYQQIDYVLSLGECILAECDRARRSDLEGRLLKVLVLRNYNTEPFIEYYKKVQLDYLDTLPELQEQIDALWLMERDLQVEAYKELIYCYDPRRNSARMVLHEFLKAELLFKMNKAEALRSIVQRNFGTGQTGSVRAEYVVNPYKIHTTMTVDMLAYFIRLMVSAKVIEPGVKEELMAFVATIFQTPGTGSKGIAPGSLYTKSRQVVQSTSRAVRALVARMLREIDKEFGEDLK